MTTTDPAKIEARNARRRAAYALKKSSLSPDFVARMNQAGDGALEVIARHAKKVEHPCDRCGKENETHAECNMCQPCREEFMAESAKRQADIAEHETLPASPVVETLPQPSLAQSKMSAALETLLAMPPAAPAPTKKFAKVPMPELVTAVRAYAYTQHGLKGWGLIEASSDEALIVIIDKATSVGGAIINARVYAKSRS